MSSSNDQVSNPSIYGEVDLENAYKLTTPSGKVVVVNARRHGWRIPEVINPSLQSVVPLQDRNVYTYYEQLMALKRAAVAIVEEIAEMTDSLLPDVTAEDANKVLVVNGDGTGVEWKRSSASGVDAEVTQTDYGAHIEIVNSGYKTEADIYNGTDGAKGDPGFSPTANVQPTATGALITITDQNGTTTATVNNGETGPKGEPGVSPTASVQRVEGGAEITVTDEFGTTTAKVNDGADGLVGRDGVDGVSPTASVTQVNPNTVRFDVTDKNGTTSATLTGEAGQDGVDGISPTATVTQTPTGATVSITDKNGTTTANLTNGSNGSNGVDGVSPSATVTQTDTGATVTITDHNGTTTANLTNGQRGSDGSDGYSPSASVTQTDSGATINITDKNGTTTASVTNGAKGDTGEGVPAGGDQGQILRKKSNTDYDTEWVTPDVAEGVQYSLDWDENTRELMLTDTATTNTQRLELTGLGSGGSSDIVVIKSDNLPTPNQLDAYWNNRANKMLFYCDLQRTSLERVVSTFREGDQVYITTISSDSNTLTTYNFEVSNYDLDAPIVYVSTSSKGNLPFFTHVNLNATTEIRPSHVRLVGYDGTVPVYDMDLYLPSLPDSTMMAYNLTDRLANWSSFRFRGVMYGLTTDGVVINRGRQDDAGKPGNVVVQALLSNSKTIQIRTYEAASNKGLYFTVRFSGYYGTV